MTTTMNEQLLRVISQNEAAGKDPHQVRAMLANGANVMARDSEGRTALHYAVNSPLSVTRVLLDWGAMVNAEDQAGLTPLHVCTMWGLTNTACLLLDHGANLFATDKEGRTPKCRAVNDRIVSTLLMHKKKLDTFAIQNAQLIALVGHKNRMKFEKLLQDQSEKMTAHMQQQKAEIVGIVKTMEQQQQSPQLKLEEAEDMYKAPRVVLQQQQQDHGHSPKKRKKWIPDTIVASTPVTAATNDGCSKQEEVYLERMARFEEQLQEQRAEMESLKGILMSREEPAALPAAEETVLSTSDLCSNVKVEEEEQAVEEEVDATISPTAEEQRDDKINVMLATIKQELQNVHEELDAARETAKRYKKERDDYKMERDHYKKKMGKLHQLTGQI